MASNKGLCPKLKNHQLGWWIFIPFDEVEGRIGHAVGGVCPFGINEGVEVYLDVSLKRFSHIYPACGSSNSAIKMTLSELELTSNYQKWIDVCKIIE